MNKKETPRDSDQKRESLSKPLEVEAENGQPEEKTSTAKLLLIIGIVVLAIVVLVFFWKYVLKKFDIIGNILEFCESLAPNKFRNYMITFAVICACQFFFFPGQSTFVALSGYFIGNYWSALLRFVIILWPVKLFGFLMVKHCIYHRVYHKFHENDVYQAINLESKRNGWVTSFIVNLMWIMSSIKMYIIPLLSITVWQFIPFMMIGEVMYASLFILVGMEVKDVYSFINGSYDNFSPAQKVSYFVFMAFTVVTVVTILFLFYKIGVRVNQLKELHQLGKQERELIEEERMLEGPAAHVYEAA